MFGIPAPIHFARIVIRDIYEGIFISRDPLFFDGRDL